MDDGKSSDAIAMLQQLCLKAPNDAAVHCNLGLALQNDGQFDKAEEEYKLALRLNPEIPEAMLNLASTYQCMGQNSAAVEWLNRYKRYCRTPGEFSSVEQLITSLNEQPLAKMNGSDYLAEAGCRKPGWNTAHDGILVYVQSTANQQFEPSLTDALNQWSTASGGTLSFRRTTSAAEADLLIDFTRTPMYGVERGFTQRICDQPARFHVVINTAPAQWHTKVSDEIIRKACLHEIGHAIGIHGHSANIHDVMFCTVDSPAVKSALTERDKNTISRLYGK